MSEQTRQQKQLAIVYDAVRPIIADLGFSVVRTQVLCNAIAREVVEQLPAIEAAQGQWGDS